MKLIYTVELDPGDCPEVRNRLRIAPDRVGLWVAKAMRDAIDEALWIMGPEDYYGLSGEYRQPRVGPIKLRIDGPRDTWKEPTRG